MSREVRRVPKEWVHPVDSRGRFIPLFEGTQVAAAGLQPETCMPVWEQSECTHLMMYETITEGTPCSPAFSQDWELAAWLAQNDVLWAAREVGSVEDWLAVIRDSTNSMPIVVSSSVDLDGATLR